MVRATLFLLVSCATALLAPVPRLARRACLTTTRRPAGESDEAVEALREQAAALRAEVEQLEAEAKAQRLLDEKLKPAAEPEPAREPAKTDPIVAAVARKKEGTSATKDEGGLLGGFELPELPSLFGGDDDAAGGGKKKAPEKRKVAAPEDDVTPLARALACAPYLLPLSDAVPFGQFVFNDFPLLGVVLIGPFAPFLALIQAIPFGQFILFLALATQSRNAELPRFARFSMQQAVLLDIALIFPQLAGSVTAATGARVPEAIVEPGSSAVFFFIVASILYSCGSNALGKLPNNIPIISQAAERSIGPF